MPHETSSIFTLERPFRGPANACVRSWAGFGRSTWLSVDGLLGFPASSNVLDGREHGERGVHIVDTSVRWRWRAYKLRERLEPMRTKLGPGGASNLQ